MRVRSAMALCVCLLLGTVAFAQDYPKVELGLGYSYTRFNLENSSIVRGFALNGGGADFTYFVTKSLGIKAEFQGTLSQTRVFTLPDTLCNVTAESACILAVKGNLFTYHVLAEYKARLGKFEPYVEGGFGRAQSNIYGNLLNACGLNCAFVKKPSNSALDFVVGGGFDIPITPSIAIRPGQFDFIRTRFGNGFTRGSQNQSNFRFQAGVVFRF